MRLIDADAVIELINNGYLCFETPTDILLSIKEIEELPTIDPVRHEHWTRKKMLNHPLGTWKTLCMCSGCRHTQLTESAFCGGCGAKMDGDADE